MGGGGGGGGLRSGSSEKGIPVVLSAGGTDQRRGKGWLVWVEEGIPQGLNW